MKKKRHSTYQREYYLKHRANLLVAAKRRRNQGNNRQKHAEYMREYYQTRLKNNPEYRAKRLEYFRKYTAENRHKMNAYNTVYREKNREKIRLWAREYYAKNRKLVGQRARARKYGITADQFAAAVKKQNGLCPVCGEKLPKNHSRIATDHCHKTGVVRGLLHVGCNVAVGAYERLGEQIKAYLGRCEIKPSP
jgi:DNA repair exonuclease SbcCD ATPase subunit